MNKSNFQVLGHICTLNKLIPFWLILITYSVSCQNNLCLKTPGTTYIVGLLPQSITSGDINNDGIIDLAVTAYNSNTIKVFRGTGTGSFVSVANVNANNPNDVAIGDINSDGNADLIFVEDLNNSLVIYVGNGAGAFFYGISYNVGSNQTSLIVEDLNGDGFKDIATCYTNKLAVLINQGTGLFNTPLSFTGDNAPSAISCADLNGDGRKDLVVANDGGFNIRVYLNNGLSSIFSSSSIYTVGNSPYATAIADFNKDGKKDIAVSASNSNRVDLLLGNGTGGFGSLTSHTVGVLPLGITADDFNNDGIPDIITSNYSSNNITFLPGNGTNFGSPTNYTVGTNPFMLTSADFDGDLSPDVAIAVEGNNNMRILKNVSAFIRVVGSETICIGGSTLLKGTTGAASYLWNPTLDTGDSTIATAGGIYTLTISNGTCTSVATKSITQVVCTEINEISSKKEIEIYPNPNNGSFNVKLDNISDGTVLKIYGVFGDEIETIEANSLIIEVSLSDYPQGVYFLTLTQKNQPIKNSKIIKE
jgi:hypothetical protein